MPDEQCRTSSALESVVRLKEGIPIAGFCHVAVNNDAVDRVAGLVDDLVVVTVC